MKKVIFFDSTLRDGSHAIGHQFDEESVTKYCKEADEAGLHTLIVGHGNGLGASSLQVGISKTSDERIICAARENLKETKLGCFLIPGFGTIKDDLAPAIENGIQLLCVGIHCTEADITKQYIEYARDNNIEVFGVLMMYHMAAKEVLLGEAKKMQDYGAQGVILMDSAGASLPEMVKETVSFFANNLEIEVGFHAHNNLGLAISNSLLAINQGATIVDGTLRGLGAGAGNCQLEVLAAILHKLGIQTGLDLYKLMDISDKIVATFMKKPQEINSITLVSGMAGVFSGFAPHVQKAAERFGVDPREIFMELGRRQMIGGQEDFVVDVAMYLSQKKKIATESYNIESLL